MSQISNSTLFWQNLFHGCDCEMKEWGKVYFREVACAATLVTISLRDNSPTILCFSVFIRATDQ